MVNEQGNVLLSGQDDALLTQQDNVMLTQQDSVMLSEAEASGIHPTSQPPHPKPGLGVGFKTLRQAQCHSTSA